MFKSPSSDASPTGYSSMNHFSTMSPNMATSNSSNSSRLQPRLNTSQFSPADSSNYNSHYNQQQNHQQYQSSLSPITMNGTSGMNTNFSPRSTLSPTRNTTTMASTPTYRNNSTPRSTTGGEYTMQSAHGIHNSYDTNMHNNMSNSMNNMQNIHNISMQESPMNMIEKIEIDRLNYANNREVEYRIRQELEESKFLLMKRITITDGNQILEADTIR